MSTMRFVSHCRPAASLIARIFPQRELLLKHSWIIGGYGRALPRRRPATDAIGRPLQRLYQLRHDQIVGPEQAVLELRKDQIIAQGARVREFVRAPLPAVSAAA